MFTSKLRVMDFMTPRTSVSRCSMDDSIAEVVRTMQDNQLSALILHDNGGRAFAVVSRSDILKFCSDGVRINLPIGAVAKPSLSLNPRASSMEALNAIVKSGAEYAFVAEPCTDDVKLLGIVSLYDLSGEGMAEGRRNRASVEDLLEDAPSLSVSNSRPTYRKVERQGAEERASVMEIDNQNINAFETSAGAPADRGNSSDFDVTRSQWAGSEPSTSSSGGAGNSWGNTSVNPCQDQRLRGSLLQNTSMMLSGASMQLNAHKRQVHSLPARWLGSSAALSDSDGLSSPITQCLQSSTEQVVPNTKRRRDGAWQVVPFV